MQRLAMLVSCLLLGALPQSGRVEAAATISSAATQTGFTFCTVTDMSGGGMGTAKIWASPVFAFEHRADDGGGFARTAELATEFHALVGSLGGSGDKSCYPSVLPRAELEAVRSQQRAEWTKRVMLWASKWQDVAWTPAPWNPDAVKAAPAIVTRFVYCLATDVDPDVRKTVASLVFDVGVPSNDPMAEYTQSAAYQAEFQRDVMPAHGVANASPSCVVKDTLAEAEKSRKEYRRLFGGFNMRFVDLAWRPGGRTPAVPAVPAPAPPPTSTAPAPAPAPAVPPEPAATHASLDTGPQVRKYCHAFMQSVGQRGGVRSTVFEDMGSDGSDAAMTASLAAFVAHVRVTHPGQWHEFKIPPAQCFAGSGYCIAKVLKRFGGPSQIAGQFCERSREQAETGWAGLGESDTTMEIIAWPAAS